MLALILAAVACDPPDSVAADLRSEAVAPALRGGSAPLRPRYLALVTPRYSVEIKSTVPGQLSELVVGLGDRVEAGQPVALLDNVDLRYELELTEASLVSASARLSELRHAAEFAGQRAQKTAELQDYVSRDEREQRHYDLRRAKALARSARGTLAVEEVRVERLRAQIAALALEAPFAARVAAVYRAPGQQVLAHEPLVRLSSTEYVLRFAIDVGEIGELEIGGALEFVHEGDPGALPARIIALAPEADAAGMIVVEATLVKTEPARIPPAGSQGYVYFVRSSIQ